METSSFSTEGFTFIACRRLGNLGATSRKRECEQQNRVSSRKAFLGGVACVVIWGALWWLLIYAYQFPGKGAGLDISLANSAAASALSKSEIKPQVPDAASLDGRQRRCRPGAVELKGLCVLGEEIRVRAPVRWRSGQ